MHHRLLIGSCLLLPMLTGCDQEVTPREQTVRAVSYIPLVVSEPTVGSRLTGTVESWKREDLGFEVAGRVLKIVEPGIDIEGRTYDEDGQLISEGTVLAEIDSERYEIAKKQAETASDAARTDLEQVIPEMLAEAEAALALADTELQRYRNLVAKESAPQQRLDVAETAQKAAAAKVAQVEALRATKAALLSSSLAAVEQADVNIADCKITSPFNGQIARVQMIPGGYALPGQAVVTVQMMDPMKVQIAVSPKIDQALNFNDRLRVYLPGVDEPLRGYVYLKDTYADPATRTYLVTLLVRNRRIISGVPDELKDSGVATTQKLWTLLPETPGGDDRFYIEVNALQKDDQGYFIWKVNNLTVEQLYDSYDPLLEVSKVRVTPGDGRMPALQVFTFRELVDFGELDPEVDVIVGEIDGEVTNGQVVMTQQRWLMRPGDLAEVSVRGLDKPSGFYVPRIAIMGDGDSRHIFTVAPGSDIAKKIGVQALETQGQTQRVEAVDPNALSAGDRVIVGAAHYVQDGERVSLVRELEGLQ